MEELKGYLDSVNLSIRRDNRSMGQLDDTCNSEKMSQSWLEKMEVTLKSALVSHDSLCFSKKRLIKAVIEFMQQDAFDEFMRSELGFYFLLELIHLRNPDVQILGCLILAKYAKRLPEDLLRCTIPFLIGLINFDSASQGSFHKEVSAFAMKNVAKRGEELRLTLGQSGAFAALSNLVSQPDERLQILGLQTLKELVFCTKANQETFAEAGGIQVILNLVSSSSVLVKALAAELLGVLASLQQVRRAITNRSGILSLVEAVKIGCMASRTRAAHALGLLAFTKRLRRLIGRAGGIDVLIDLLHNGDQTAKLVAGNSLGIVSACVDHLRQVAQAGAIPLYVNLLEEGNPFGKDITEDAFCILAVSEENALIIMEHLVRILCHGDATAKAAAADIIWDVSSYGHSVSVVMVSGAIPHLVALLRDENEEIRENVSGAIAQLTYNDEDKHALAETGAIPILIELLQDQSSEVKGNAMEALHNFMEDSCYRSEILGACPVSHLVVLQDIVSSGSIIRDAPEHAAAAMHSLEDGM